MDSGRPELLQRAENHRSVSFGQVTCQRERVNGREREVRGRSLYSNGPFSGPPHLKADKGAIDFLYLVSEIRDLSKHFFLLPASVLPHS